MTRLSNILLCFALIIGPLWVGSYFGDFRWPLIYSACAAGIVGIAVSWPKRGWISFSVMLTLLLLIAAQGYWMHYNTSTVFIENEIIGNVHYYWQFIPVENQPYPEHPGGIDKVDSWDRLSYILPCLLIVLAVRQMVASKVLSLRTLCGTIFWTGVAIAALGLVQRFTEADGIYWNEEWSLNNRSLFFGTYRSPAIATTYLNMGFALGLAYLLDITRAQLRSRNPKPTQPILTCIGLIVIFSGAMTAGSKAGTVFAVVTLLLWILMNFKRIIAMVRGAGSLLPSGSPHERNILIGAVVIAGVLAVLSLGGVVSERWEKSIDGDHRTLELRHIANSIQLEMIDQPEWDWAGYGPGSFIRLFPFHNHHSGFKTLWSYAHNDHLQTLVEWGWFGTGCFALLIGGGAVIVLSEPIIAAIRKKRLHRTSNLYYFRGIAIAMFICLLHATVDFPFQIESIAISFAAILGAAWGGRTLRVN